jgi:hypothetical protein
MEINMQLNGRKIIDVEIDGVDTRDSPDFCDAYFSYAVYADNNQELTDSELETLTEFYSDVINEMAHEKYCE